MILVQKLSVATLSHEINEKTVQNREGKNCWELLEQWQEKLFVGRWVGKRKGREMYG